MLHLASKIKASLYSGKTGGTFSLSGKSMNFDSGYIVGISGEVVPSNSSVLQVRQALVDIYCKSQPKLYGFWMHEGNIYIDHVERFDCIDKAIQKANECNQIAIFDCGRGEDIFVNELFNF